MTPAYIMAVPWDVKRMKRAVALKKEIDATIVLDETQNPMDTFRLMLQKIVADGDGPCFIFEDDVILCANWREKAEAVVAERPHQVCQFFSMVSEESAHRLGSHEALGSSFIGNLCVYLPAGYASAILEHSYEFVEKNPAFATANDFVLRDLLKQRKEKYWLQFPNLVQHEAHWRSSIGGRTAVRKSNWFDEATS